MRRKCLLSVAMLSVLLATSACGAGTADPGFSPQPAGSTGGTGGSYSAGADSTKGPEIGVSQWNAAEAVKSAEAKAAEDAEADAKAAALEAAAAAAEAAAAGKAEAAKKAAEAKKAAKEAEAKKAAAAEKAAEAKKAAEDAAAKKGAAPVPTKTPPADDTGFRQVDPVPTDPPTAGDECGHGEHHGNHSCRDEHETGRGEAPDPDGTNG